MFPNELSKESLLLKSSSSGFSTVLLESILDGLLATSNCRFKHECSSTPAIVLISGSLRFLTRQCQLSYSCPMIGVLDSHYQGRLRNGRPNGTDPFQLASGTSWKRVRHVSCGGSSEFTTLFVSTNCDFVPAVSCLERSIKDFFDDQIKPTLSKPPVTLGAEECSRLYTLHSRLVIGAYQREVLHPTRFFCTGWGRRPLTIKELGLCHGFPRNHVQYLTMTELNLPPLQSLTAMFAPAYKYLASLSNTVAPTTIVPLCHQEKVDDHQTWLPSIQRYLSHSWIDDTVITQKAAKRDNALAPSHIWDVRLLLLFPKARLVHLDTLRRWLLGVLCRRLYLEFKSYLHHKFSTTTQSWFEQYGLGRPVFRSQLGGDKSTNESRTKSTNESRTSKDRNNLYNIDLVKGNYWELCYEIQLGIDILSKLCASSWWEWDQGSSLIFWRWGEFAEIARDGMKPYICSKLPQWKRPVRKPLPSKIHLVADKLQTIVNRGYVAAGHVESLADFFDVPKGEEDIRLVYNGSSCGLNKAIWCPNFWLPFPRSALRLLDFSYYSADMDLGEMFLNFPLHESIQAYSGIDLSHFRKELKVPPSKSSWLRWTRNWMGAKSSPYSSVRFFGLVEEFVRGNPLDKENSLRWDVIKLNLPGSELFDPNKPRVQKWDSVNQRIAGDMITFVDDIRASAQTPECTWKICRQVSGRTQYLGVQDASRKRRPPSRSPGPWAGSVFKTSATSVIQTVTEEKWLKGRKLVNELWLALAEEEMGGDIFFEYKQLEIARGYLGHLSMTIEIIVPYLKGFHLTLAAHLNQRDADGWKFTDREWKNYVEAKVVDEGLDEYEARILAVGEVYSPHNHPTKVKPVQQLKDDLFALHEFFLVDKPPIIQDRCKDIRIVRYGFGDASGRGFGSTIQTSQGLKYRIGIWGPDDDQESSNYKELENVVSTIEEEESLGTLKGSVLFFFTDNATVEAALCKGNSSSKKLFHLVVRFRKCQCRCGSQVVVSHVSGKRMIAQGTDGVSRGNLLEGVGSGSDMMSFIPLHLNAFERSPLLAEWMTSWTGKEAEVLTSEQWFTRGHDHSGGFYDKKGFWRIETTPGIFIWAPPPAGAEVALEEMRKAIIKRQMSTHIIVIPRLLTSEWRRQLFKASDLVFNLLPGVVSGWPAEMLEPLTIGFVFPLLSSKPWQRRGTPQMCFMARELLRVQEESELATGNLLQSFFSKQQRLARMPEHVVWKVLHFQQ